MSDLAKRLEKAEKLFQKGKHDAALEEYLEVLKEDPNNDHVCQTAADLCISLNRAAEAATLLGAMFDHQASIGDVAKATITYKKLVRVTTPSVERCFHYGQLVEKSNRKEALESFETAVAGFKAAGRKAEALAALKRIIALDPTVDNYQREGELSAELGDSKAASAAFFAAGGLDKKAGGDGFACYERAFTLDPTNQGAALANGCGLLDKGDAAKAISILEPFATLPGSSVDFREAYGRGLLAVGRPLDAEPYVWDGFEQDPKRIEDVAKVIAALIDVEQYARAQALAQKLEAHELKAGRRREYVNLIKAVTDKHPPSIEFLEYLVELFNTSNREADYCATLLKLFELYYAGGNFLKAGDSLDRAGEVDPYEPGHAKRLEMLRGKIDGNYFNAIANRFTSVGLVEEQSEAAKIESEPTVLEDFMLQAEIFLQYSMRSRAVERLQRINKLFPYEEEKNEKLRQLFMNAGFVPKYEGVPRPSVPTPAPTAAPSSAAAAPAVPQAVADESAVDNISRVTEITRNIYRQGNVKSVLFTAVNEVGRHWSASRCVAGLCTPGKPPSAALEYCAPNIKQSDVMAIVKLIGTLQALCVEKGVLLLPQAQSAPDLASLQPILATLDIHSLLVVPLFEGDEHVGILILEQCGAPRQWRSTDVVVLKTIADQTVQAVSNAKLRSLMKTLAVTEEKSGLLKRSSYLDVLSSEVRRALQQNSTATLMLFHFGRTSALVKEVGEAAVENMMQQISQLMCSHLRQSDIAVRYELTTIALILPDTNEKNAFFVVDKMRKVLAPVKVPATDRPVPITAGIAEAVMQPKFDPVDIVTEVINRGENALEAAKAEGGNKAQSLAPSYESAAVA